jgi:ankyrin repeat protein
MIGNYATTLLKLIHQQTDQDFYQEFTSITHVPLPSMTEIGYLPSIVNTCSFSWTKMLVNSPYWQPTIQNIQNKYKKLLNPYEIELKIIPAQGLEKCYHLGVDYSGTLAICIEKSRINLAKISINFTVVMLPDGPLQLVVTLNTEAKINVNGTILYEERAELNLATAELQQINFAHQFAQDKIAFNVYSFYDKRKIKSWCSRLAISDLDYLDVESNIASKYVLYNPKHDSILIRAIENNWPLVVIKTLLDLGADLMQSDKNGRYPHHHAAIHNKREILELFLNINNDLLNLTDHDERSALSLAAHKKAKECVELLLSKPGVEFDGCSKTGHTALEYAVLGDDRQTLEKMLAHNDAISVRLANRKHPTLLHMAIDNEHHTRIFAIQTLLQHEKCHVQQDLLIYNEQGLSAFHVAIQKSNMTTIGLLLPSANILHPTVKEQASCPELALERLKLADNEENRLIFKTIFDAFLFKATQEQFLAFWNKLQPKLDKPLLESLEILFSQLAGKITLLSQPKVNDLNRETSLTALPENNSPLSSTPTRRALVTIDERTDNAFANTKPTRLGKLMRNVKEVRNKFTG